MKNSKNWKGDIRSKLASSEGIHCEQAKLLAECAAALVKENATDKEQRIKWLLAQAKEHGLTLSCQSLTMGWLTLGSSVGYGSRTENILRASLRCISR